MLPQNQVCGQGVSQAEVKTFRALGQLSRDEAAKGRPACITAIVVCADADWGQLFIQDDTEARYFSPKAFNANLEAGQKVEITGKTTFADGYPFLTNLTLKVLGKGPLPKAPGRELAQLINGLGQWIETRGRVRIADTTSGRLTLVLEDKGQTALVFVMGPLVPAFAYKGLVGCKVSLRGINTSKVIQGRLEPASLTSPALDELKVIEPRGNDPWQAPVVSIDSLLSRELGPWTNEPVHINGIVANYRPSNYLEVKDATGNIQARVLHLGGIKLNGRVDLWGFLVITPDGPILRDAFFELGATQGRRLPDADSHGSSALMGAKVLTKVSDIIKLDAPAAAQRMPARLRGVITYADPEWRSVFFQDQTGAIYVECGQSDVRSGQYVELQGQTDPGGFAPQLLNGTVKILGTTNLPAPANSDLEDLANGRLDAHWVQLEGIVRRVSQEWGHLMLTLMMPAGRFKVLVPNFNNQRVPVELIDARVSVQGACGLELNTRGQLSGIVLHTPSLEQIHILDSVPADPFAGRPIPIGMVSTFDPRHLSGRRVKVAGTVTFLDQNGEFFVQDNSGGIHVALQQAKTLRAGEAVEVLGFPAVGDFAPYLEEAAVRVITNGVRLPAPKTLTAEAIMSHGTNDGQLVQVEAQLVQRVPRAARPKLVLQDGSIIFNATLKETLASQKLFDMRPGSVLRLAGICIIQGAENHEPASFRLLVPSGRDIKLIREPSWWTARHTFMVAGSLSIAVMGSLAWVRSLRRQVRLQTEVIRQKLEERNQFAASLEREKAELAATQKRLVETSRQAGMAEVATSVLHNVGNVLNSINVSASVMAKGLKESKIASLKKLAGLISENRTNLAGFFSGKGKGKEVPAYLEQLAAHLADEQQTLRKELDLMERNVDHIKEIVAMQQNYAKVSGVVEPHHVKDLIEDALRMNEGAFERHEVQLIREIDPALPVLNVDKHKVLQILINLLRNAKYACDESGRGDKQLMLRAANGNGTIKISVIDNGVGIPPENLTRIFNHGFTTRKNGHGFGLHSGALAAKEMGGRLFAQSDGVGKGATFTLELPITNQN
jgi:signal transduction histidine kinase